MDFLSNLSDKEKTNYEQAWGNSLTQSGTFVDVAGDTMTGILNGTGIAMTATASLAAANVPALTSSAAVFTSMASMAQARIYSTIATNPALTILQTVASAATIAPLNIIASAASQAFISFSGAFISSASYGGLANTNAFVIPVYHETQRVFGYIGAQKALV